MARSQFAPRRTRSVWAALSAGVLAVVGSALLVLAPLMTLIAGAAGAAWFVHIPFGRIWFVVGAGYLLAAGLLALILRTRRSAIAWILAVSATVAAMTVSLYPVVAVAIAATNQASEIIPFITDLIREGTALFR